MLSPEQAASVAGVYGPGVADMAGTVIPMLPPDDPDWEEAWPLFEGWARR